MGQISLLKFKKEKQAESKVDSIIRGAPYFSEYDPENQEYYFRGEENVRKHHDMPDAYVKIHSLGLEFCAYSSGRVIGEINDYLIRALSEIFGDVQEEW